MKALTCSVRYFCFGGFLIFLGTVLLCALGFTIVLPYEATRSWPQVTCNVTNATFDEWECSCVQQAPEYIQRGECLGLYPCLQIYVTFKPEQISHPPARLIAQHNESRSGECRENDTITMTSSPSDSLGDLDVGAVARSRNTFETSRGRVRHSGKRKSRGTRSVSSEGIEVVPPAVGVGLLYRSWGDAFYKTCSLHECGYEEWNVKEARRFLKEWGGEGHTYPCHFDPSDPGVVILARSSHTMVVHAIVWPCLCLTSGVFIWLGLCLGCWTIEMEKNPAPRIERNQLHVL